MRTCTPVKVLELLAQHALPLVLSAQHALPLVLLVQHALPLEPSAQHALKEKRQSIPKWQEYKLARQPTSKLFSLTGPTFHVTVE